MNYQEMLKSTYAEVVSYLKEKYGEAKYNYFSNESMKSKNAKISKDKRGFSMSSHRRNRNNAIK